MFRNWVDEPFLIAGLALMAIGTGLALWLTLPLPRSYPAAAGVVAVLGAAAMLLAATAVSRGRAHPQDAQVHDLASLASVPGVFGDRISEGSEAPDTYLPGFISLQDDLQAGPAAEGPPTAVRSWEFVSGTDACRQTESVAVRWVDHGSLRPQWALPQVGDLCYWFAQYHGWQVSIRVFDIPGHTQLGTHAVIQLGTADVL